MYSLVSAPVLGFDLARLEGGSAAAKAVDNVKNLAVTSEGTPEMRKAAEDAGALFLVTKPFTDDTFRDALDPILG